MSAPTLEVEDLTVSFATEDGVVRAVDGVSYAVQAGRTLAIVGESGAGKSVAAMTLLGLTRAKRTTISGAARLGGRDLLSLGPKALRGVRGGELAMIFQDSLASLHPFYRIGAQLAEGVRAHQAVGQAAALRQAVAMLERVGIPDPERRARAYPHELSGGTRQRVMIAMALLNGPRVLIADEPTTALDVTVQAQILDLIAELQAERGTAVVLITHDLGVAAQVADEIAVMYAGRIVEYAGATELFARPEHPYTWGLMRSIPHLDGPADQVRGELEPIPGTPPSLIVPPSGCAFHPRCPYVRPRHREVEPTLEAVRSGHAVACLLPARARARIRDALHAGQPADAARAAGEAER